MQRRRIAAAVVARLLQPCGDLEEARPASRRVLQLVAELAHLVRLRLMGLGLGLGLGVRVRVRVRVRVHLRLTWLGLGLGFTCGSLAPYHLLPITH